MPPTVYTDVERQNNWDWLYLQLTIITAEFPVKLFTVRVEIYGNIESKANKFSVQMRKIMNQPILTKCLKKLQVQRKKMTS